jgi:hypothetical protein
VDSSRGGVATSGCAKLWLLKGLLGAITKSTLESSVSRPLPLISLGNRASDWFLAGFMAGDPVGEAIVPQYTASNSAPCAS